MSLVRSKKQADFKTFYNQVLKAVRFSRHQEENTQKMPQFAWQQVLVKPYRPEESNMRFSNYWRKKITCQGGIMYPRKPSIRNKGYIKVFSDKQKIKKVYPHQFYPKMAKCYSSTGRWVLLWLNREGIKLHKSLENPSVSEPQLAT